MSDATAPTPAARRDLTLGFERRVAWRFLREGRFQTLLIVGGVAAGVAVVAYISALVGGLQRNTLEKTLGTQAHVSVQPPDERVLPALQRSDATHVIADTQPRAQRLRGIANWPAVVGVLAAEPGVVAVSPMVNGAALVRRGEASRSVSVSGVLLDRYDRIVRLHERVVAGTMTLAPGETIIGATLADDLGVRVGDRIALDTGSRDDLLRVAALVDFGARELDRRTVIVPLKSAQTLFDLPGGASRIELALADPQAAQLVTDRLAPRLALKVESWQQANAQLVAALNAQSVSTLLIRVVVAIVVVLGIASVLVVSVVQKQREIGILRAMGATRAQVLRVFLLQGAIVALAGSLAGVGLAAAMVALFMRFVRGSDGLPLFALELPASLALQVVALASVAGVLAALAPARRASRMDPAQAIRL